MITIKYNPSDLRYIFIQGDEVKLLEEHLNKIPPYMFLPSFNGIPRPEVFLNRIRSKNIYYCHSGLWREIVEFCKSKNIAVSGIDNNFKYRGMIPYEEFMDEVKSWKLNISPRDYQLKAAWMILNYRQSLSQLATRAGKTLIAYIVFRYLLEHGAKKILMVVPSIQLVKQGVEDFKEYKEFFKTETVWAKSEYCDSANLTIGTYQSLVQRADKKNKKYDPNFFKDYDVVCIDEAHHLVCKSINTILGLDFLKNVKIKFGFTGTLPKENTIESFCCQSLMGPKIQDLSAKELIDEGFLAEPIIKQIRINYDEDLTKDYIRFGEYLCSNDLNPKELLPKDQRSFTMKYKKILPVALRELRKRYDDISYKDYLISLCKAKGSNLLMLEQMLVHNSEKHLQVIKDILKQHNNNFIVFAHHTEYISYIESELKKCFPERVILKITGSTNIKKRTEILKIMEENNNIILVASYGCCGTGITFKNVAGGIFAQSFKSEIINKQSLGRLMLRNNEKDKFYLYDIVDIFPTKRIYLQGVAKIKTYKAEGYDVEIL